MQLDETDGDQERSQPAHKQNEEVLIGGILIKGNAEHAAPDGEKTDTHHDDLREFHQHQVVPVHVLIGPDERDALLWRFRTFYNAACER